MPRCHHLSALRRTAAMLAAAAFTTALAQDPRGLFVAPANGGAGAGTHPAVRFRIELDHNGRGEPVASNHVFRSGDRFRFLFELNSSCYVYIVNRSVQGDPAAMGALTGTRGINVVNQAPRGNAPVASGLQLLWPQPGGAARVPGSQAHTIPGPSQFFEFDANPGMEKIALLISPYAVDPGIYFPALGRRARPSTPGPRLDTNEEVLAQLDDLGSADSNTTTDPGVSRGICVGDCSQYSAPKNPARPFILTVDLMHAR